MDQLFVGLDVAKDHLDGHVRPSGEAFVVSHDEAGLIQLVARLQALRPTLVVLEATGGYEATVAATLASAHLRSSIPARSGISPAPRGPSPKPIRWTPTSSPVLPKPCARPFGRCPPKTPSTSASSSPAGVNSWRCSGRRPIGGA